MYKIRKAVAADIEILLQFEQGIIIAERPYDPTLKEEHINYYDLLELIEKKTSEVYVATYNEKIVASGYVKILQAKPYLDHKEYGYLGFMFVDEEHRGKGVNKQIVEVLTEWCKQRKIYEIKLDVYDGNEPAIRAYEKAGFKKYITTMRIRLDT